MSEVYLVRHAKAGERRLWTGNDMDRPLSKKGRKQSAAVAHKLRKKATVLLSSPYVRCIETLEPLAALLDSEVEIEQRLCEDEPVGPLLKLISEAPSGAVLCSHGDLIPAAITALKKDGAELRGKKDWRKASVWVLKRNKHGRIVRATNWPPPTL